MFSMAKGDMNEVGIGLLGMGTVGGGVVELLARHARHFAWHADLWDGLVPVLHDVAVPDGVSDPGIQEAVAALGAVTVPAGVYEDVLPHVVGTYRRWAEEASPVAERPIMRVLDLTLRDVDFDAQEGHEHFKG